MRGTMSVAVFLLVAITLVLIPVGLQFAGRILLFVFFVLCINTVNIDTVKRGGKQ